MSPALLQLAREAMEARDRQWIEPDKIFNHHYDSTKPFNPNDAIKAAYGVTDLGCLGDVITTQRELTERWWKVTEGKPGSMT